VKTDEMKQGITLAYLNAKLQRADKMPPLHKLIEPRRKATYREFVDRLKAAPTHVIAGS
jgi:hypothetical protein